MEYGYLDINVRTAAGALPIQGALVTVTGYYDENGKSEIISVSRSDSSGNVPMQTLSAPNRELSQNAPALGEKKEKVYAIYGIIVEKEGYSRIEDNEIPIFSGVTSVKTVFLTPNMYKSNKSRDELSQPRPDYLL